MASSVDPTIPADGSPASKSAFRNQFLVIKNELEALQAGTSLDINSLTSIGSPDASDELAIYDLSAGSLKKVTVSTLNASAVNINSLSAVDPPALDDELMIYDTSAGTNKKVLVEDVPNINALTDIGSPANTDELVVYDVSEGVNKKVTVNNIPTSAVDINSLSDVGAPATNDELILYDTSAAGNKKVLMSAVPNITSLTDVGAPAITDEILVYDVSAAANKKLLVSAVPNITGLTDIGTPASDDELVIYDTSAAANKKVSYSAFTGVDITSQSDIGVPAVDDELLIYDTSAGSNKKVQISNLDRLGSEATVTYGATTSWDLSAAPHGVLTLTGNTTLNASNITDGQLYLLRVVQDGTGSHTLTWGTGFRSAAFTDLNILSAASAETPLLLIGMDGELEPPNLRLLGDIAFVDFGALNAADVLQDDGANSLGATVQAAFNNVAASLGYSAMTGTTVSTDTDSPAGKEASRYTNSNPILVTLGSSVAADDDLLLIKASGSGVIRVVNDSGFTINSSSGNASTTNVTDAVWGTPSTDAVTVTSAGGNLPVLLEGTLVNVTNHSDSDNNGYYIVTDTDKSSTTSLSLVKRSGNDPNAGGSEAVDIAVAVSTVVTGMAYAIRKGTDFILVGDTDGDKDFDGSKVTNYLSDPDEETGTSYELVLADSGKTKYGNNGSAITWTLPNWLPVGWNIKWVQWGAGQITFTAASGATINNIDSETKSEGQYASGGLEVITNSDGESAVYLLDGRTGT